MSNKIDVRKAALKDKHRKENALWRVLLACLSDIAKMEPWDKLTHEIPLAYIPKSDDQMIFFSCVRESEHSMGIFIYPTPRDYQYGTLAQENDREEARQFIEMECFTAAFTTKDEVPEKVLRVYQRLAVDFGDGLWPWVSHKRYGYLDETPHADDLAFALDALGNFHMQLCALKETNAVPDYDKGEMLLRYYSPEDDLWYNVIAPFALPPEVSSAFITLKDSPLILELSQLPASTDIPRMELDYGWLDEPVQDKANDVPYFPMHLVVSDRLNDQQLSLYHCRPEDFIGCALTALADALRKHGLPETLYVCRDESYDLLEDLTRKLGIHLKRVKHLPAAERVLRSLDAV